MIEYNDEPRRLHERRRRAHRRNWIIRNNLFRNIRAPPGQLAGPAVLMWNGSPSTIAEGNTFINCQREIAFGLTERTPDDHTGGIIRNNFIYRTQRRRRCRHRRLRLAEHAGAAQHDPHVGHLSQRRSNIASPHTTGVVIANNLLDGAVAARDGATGTVTGNYTTASPYVRQPECRRPAPQGHVDRAC